MSPTGQDCLKPQVGKILGDMSPSGVVDEDGDKLMDQSNPPVIWTPIVHVYLKRRPARAVKGLETCSSLVYTVHILTLVSQCVVPHDHLANKKKMFYTWSGVFSTYISY